MQNVRLGTSIWSSAKPIKIKLLKIAIHWFGKYQTQIVTFISDNILTGCLIFVLAVCCIYYLGVSGSVRKRFASWILAFNFCMHL